MFREGGGEDGVWVVRSKISEECTDVANEEDVEKMLLFRVFDGALRSRISRRFATQLSRLLFHSGCSLPVASPYTRRTSHHIP